MAIPVTCQCGKNYQAKDELAGRQLKCPACGQILVVPQSHSPEAEVGLGNLSGFDLPAHGASDSLPSGGGPALPSSQFPQHARTGKTHSTAATAAKNGNLWIIAATTVGGVVAVIAIISVFFVVFVPSDGEPAGEPATPDVHQEVEAPGGASNEPTSVARTLSTDSGEGTAAAKRLPGLPNAVSSPPAYLLEDAPFEVRAFFETPPADQNAAPLYLDALFEFSLDVSGCFSEAEQQKRSAIVQQRQQRSFKLQGRRLQNENAVNSSELDRALQDYAVGFEKLDLAQQRPACVFESAVGIAALLPHAQAAREVARWTDIKTQRDVEEGRLDEALTNIERLLRLSRDLQRRGLSVTQLVCVAINSICYQGCVKRVLAASNLTAEDCDRLLELLALHEQQAVDPLLESLRGEYVMMRSTLHDVKYRSGDFDPKFMEEELEVDSIGALIAGLAPGGSGSDQEASRIDTYATQMTDEDYANEVARANELYQSVITAADRPYRDQLRDISAAFARLRTSETPLVSLLSGGFPETLQAFVRSETELYGTQCLVALRRWHLQQPDTTPPDLETVVTDAGMPNVPRDPYGNAPLRITQRQGQFVIYSVGKDGQDDNAQSDWRYGQQPGDFIFSFLRE